MPMQARCLDTIPASTGMLEGNTTGTTNTGSYGIRYLQGRKLGAVEHCPG